MLAHICYVGISAIGLVTLARRLRRGAVILCYHNVVSRPSEAAGADSGLHTTREHFEKEIQWLREQCDILSLNQLADRFERGQSVTGTAAVTFDDGYAGVVRYAWPILKSYAVPATVFVISEAPGRLQGFWWDRPGIAMSPPGDRRRLLVEYRGDHDSIESQSTGAPVPRALRLAGWDELKSAVNEGLAVGSHSATHRNLTQLTEAELAREINDSRETIQQRLGVRPEWFSYPFGMMDERVKARVQAAGYRGAVTLQRGLNTSATDRCALRRINIPSSISLPAFNAWCAGLTPSASAAR
jgi:peptidoglycan/xylan/chitin deacetylase (PgdA/CDA1 family)